MKILHLKTVHRLLLINLLNEEGKGGASLSDLAKLMHIAEKIDFKKEEREALNIRVEENKVVWNVRAGGVADGEDIDVAKEFEVSDEESEKLMELFKKADEQKKFTLSDFGPVFEIAKEIGYTV